jgi:hypothetical protein
MHPQQSTISMFFLDLIQAILLVFCIMEQNKNNTDLVSLATTQQWPYSHHSDLNYDEKDKMTPHRNNNMPKEITALKANHTGGTKFNLRDDDSDIDLVGIAHQIEELQQRCSAYEQEERLFSSRRQNLPPRKLVRRQPGRWLKSKNYKHSRRRRK